MQEGQRSYPRESKADRMKKEERASVATLETRKQQRKEEMQEGQRSYPRASKTDSKRKDGQLGYPQKQRKKWERYLGERASVAILGQTGKDYGIRN